MPWWGWLLVSLSFTICALFLIGRYLARELANAILSVMSVNWEILDEEVTKTEGT